MDIMLERLNRIYPNSKFVYVSKYAPEQWVGKEYNSKFDNKAALNRWKSKPLSFEEAVDKAAFNSRYQYEATKALKMIKNDLEYSVMRGVQPSTMGTESYAGVMQGIKTFLCITCTSSGTSLSLLAHSSPK